MWRNTFQPRERQAETSDQAQTRDTSPTRRTVRDFSVHKPAVDYALQQEKLVLSNDVRSGKLLGGMNPSDRASTSGDSGSRGDDLSKIADQVYEMIYRDRDKGSRYINSAARKIVRNSDEHKIKIVKRLVERFCNPRTDEKLSYNLANVIRFIAFESMIDDPNEKFVCKVLDQIKKWKKADHDWYDDYKTMDVLSRVKEDPELDESKVAIRLQKVLDGENEFSGNEFSGFEVRLIRRLIGKLRTRGDSGSREDGPNEKFARKVIDDINMKDAGKSWYDDYKVDCIVSSVKENPELDESKVAIRLQKVLDGGNNLPFGKVKLIRYLIKELSTRENYELREDDPIKKHVLEWINNLDDVSIHMMGITYKNLMEGMLLTYLVCKTELDKVKILNRLQEVLEYNNELSKGKVLTIKDIIRDLTDVQYNRREKLERQLSAGRYFEEQEMLERNHVPTKEEKEYGISEAEMKYKLMSIHCPFLGECSSISVAYRRWRELPEETGDGDDDDDGGGGDDGGE